jgi:hypothetical protein
MNIEINIETLLFGNDAYTDHTTHTIKWQQNIYNIVLELRGKQKSIELIQTEGKKEKKSEENKI